jgi:hypothetical protein
VRRPAEAACLDGLGPKSRRGQVEELHKQSEAHSSRGAAFDDFDDDGDVAML